MGDRKLSEDEWKRTSRTGTVVNKLPDDYNRQALINERPMGNQLNKFESLKGASLDIIAFDQIQNGHTAIALSN